MKQYKCLSNQIFKTDEFSLVPIRNEDQFLIMKMRNEQIYHLRQHEVLTKKKQEEYFNNVISKLFDQDKPSQILFSVLWNGEFIGYGGLVHINWVDKNAEISFIMKTELETMHFGFFWKSYLSILEDIAYSELGLHKIFTYAFDLRPQLYTVLIESGFVEEARLKEHCNFHGKFIDVVIHSKIRSEC